MGAGGDPFPEVLRKGINFQTDPIRNMSPFTSAFEMREALEMTATGIPVSFNLGSNSSEASRAWAHHRELLLGNQHAPRFLKLQEPF